MKKLDVVLSNRIARVLEEAQHSTKARNAEAISQELLQKFYGENPVCHKRSQGNAVLPSGLSAELKELMTEDYKQLYLSSALLMTLVILTCVEFVLLAWSKIYVIPILFTGNLGLILLGYIASEYKHILALEHEHKVCVQNKEVMDALYAFLKNYEIDAESRITNDDMTRLLHMLDSLRLQAKSNGFK